MPITTKYLFMVSMDVVKEKEVLFNEIYDSKRCGDHTLFLAPGICFRI
ncbi:MAG: hypothetical protein JWQ55_4826, partial [Rhodopila sp.]|nr:hypothetical protein [Rhodopila sp.]